MASAPHSAKHLHLHWSDGKVYDDDAADPGDGGAEGSAEGGSTRQYDSGLARGMSLLKSILKDQGMTASNMPKELRSWLLPGFGVQGFRVWRFRVWCFGSDPGTQTPPEPFE